MRILLAGESTAGQLAPIIAVYEELKKKTQELALREGIEFMLISTESDFLKAFVQDTDIKYQSLESKENQKTSLFTSIKNFSRVLYGVFDYMPDVIFVKGGYVSLPVAIAGKIFHIPVLMHESDTEPRDIDKFMARFAKRIAVSFEATKNFYASEKAFFSGNPVSDFVIKADRKESRQKFMIDGDKPVLLIMGGSKGSRQINDLVMEILPELLGKYEIIHQCGIDDYEGLKSQIQKMNIPFLDDYHLFPFLKQSLANAYAACDLVVSRAGANTVAEIMLVGKPSVLIPLSDSASDNQNKNAFYFSEAGAAVLVNERNLKPHLFMETIDGIFKSKLKVMEMMRMARQLAHPEAASIVADEIIKLGK
ncbi:MAG: UDP-N-acetylglucosamine--N-acetylmuramyl-(pentapeptide) pyrophosphoryl-undecaprenol N-acetylglucosamine transferase [Candidatus Paceibacterota bacterium]